MNLISCKNLSLLPFYISKDNLILLADGTLQTINQMSAGNYQDCFSNITRLNVVPKANSCQKSCPLRPIHLHMNLFYIPTQ
jgi:hypothetical protein